MLASRSLEDIQAHLDSVLGVKTRMIKKRVPIQDLGFMVSGRPPPTRYAIEVVKERTEQWSKLVGILFCAPSSKPGKDEILPNLDYFHHRSGLVVDFFCVGYSRAPASAGAVAQTPVTSVDGASWYFDPEEFNACRAQLESSAKWTYTGETDLLLAVARKTESMPAMIDYSCVIACNLEAMARDNAFSSIRSFFEKLFQFGERFKGVDPVRRLSDKFGLEGGGNLLKVGVLSLLPQAVQAQYKATSHLAVSDASR